jgi:hypothetical protein
MVASASSVNELFPDLACPFPVAHQVIKSMNMKPALLLALLALTAYGQKLEFEAASIRLNQSQGGFHFASDSTSGGPGTSDPGMFRCADCTLATLIAKAYNLQNYQLPGRNGLEANRFEVKAKIPVGTTQEQFAAMLQNLLKDRFGLASHLTEKNLRGYHLVVAAKGSKLVESQDGPRPATPDQHGGFGQGESHAHSGPMNFGGIARYRGDHQTTAALAKILSDQLGVPVDDQTGLTGKYDVALTWSADSPAHSSGAGAAAWGGPGHADHGPGGVGSADASAPTLFEALQAQLGLKLAPAAQTAARIFVVDRFNPLPSEN